MASSVLPYRRGQPPRYHRSHHFGLGKSKQQLHRRGFLLQHIRKQKNKTVIEDLLLDQQPLQIQPEQWYTAVLEVVDDEALPHGRHIAYAKADQIKIPKNLYH